ncbi:hypothetical protein BDV93DRAFT_519040 [Ceratobasidium sp. AG-I]|nr:hypothetical protein BDV93DRAFT_519040 [Ceratobasidium sp. AG-I]
MPVSYSQLHDEGSHAFEHPATVPPSPYEMPVPVHTPGSHSPAPLEIVLDNDNIIFRGVGQDVEGAMLSGHVILNLTESTNIRELTLHLSGKIGIRQAESTAPHNRVHYTHDWSFLEGERNHKHTIKAGQHVFPFQVQLPSSIPSTGRTHSGSATVSYKLRATAVRSAFSANFHAFQAVNVMRSFLPEAMEYNQTLEIENTWPGKLMYSFVVPHKAFAAGDDIPVLVKFQPMAKGVSVKSVTSTIKEYTSIRWRGLQGQETRTVAAARHEIRNRRAVLCPLTDSTETSTHTATGAASTSTSSAPAIRSRSSGYMGMLNGHGRTGTSASAGGSGHANGDLIGHAISRLHAASSSVALAAGISSASGSADGHDWQGVASSSRLSGEVVESPVEEEAGDDEVDTSLHINLPASTSPSSSIEPILSLYKIKFSVIISNMDGHTSELRCALPIHVMDRRLAEEVRLATNATHNLLFGSENAEETQNIDLPSYQAHVLDRIAVADVAQTSRTTSNPLSRTSSSANIASMNSPHNRSGSAGYFNGRTGTTPSASVPGSPGPAVALDAVDSELLHSLGVHAHASGPSSSSNTPPESRRESRAGSRVTSRAGSRAGSRASSPERGHGHGHGGIDGHKLAGALHSNRSGGLFHFPSSMKPFTPFTKSKGHSHANSHGSTTPGSHHASGSGGHTPGTGTHSPGEPVSATSATEETLSRVPDYAVASRGFLGGGVTPLSRDLPSYDQAQQHTTSASTGDLAGLGREGEVEPVRPDAGRRSTSDLLFMRAGHHPSSSTLHSHASPSTSGSQPVR